MSELEPSTPPRAGLPTPSTVLTESLLRPSRRTPLEVTGRPVAYRVLRTTQVDPDEQELGDAELAAPGVEPSAGDDFRGITRASAKTSLATARTEDFADLSDLITSLPADMEMIARPLPIRTDAGSGRMAEEDRNVRLRAFLYAASREDDNDYHLIIGRAPSEQPMYMMMGLSGLPPQGSRDFERLQAARAAYESFFGGLLPGRSYDFYDPPIEVEVEGSLLFEMRHAAGRDGPRDLLPYMPVAWEVHPISAIALEP